MRLYQQKCAKTQLIVRGYKNISRDIRNTSAGLSHSGQHHVLLFWWDCCQIDPEDNAEFQASSWTVFLAWACIQWKTELKRLVMKYAKRLDTMSRAQEFITWQPSCQNSDPDCWCWCPGRGWLFLATERLWTLALVIHLLTETGLVWVRVQCELHWQCQSALKGIVQLFSRCSYVNVCASSTSTLRLRSKTKTNKMTKNKKWEIHIFVFFLRVRWKEKYQTQQTNKMSAVWSQDMFSLAL